MYFTKVENPKFYKRTKLAKLLEEFRDSGVRVAKLEDWHYVTAHVGASTLATAAKRCGFFHIHAIHGCGEIYLINESVDEN